MADTMKGNVLFLIGDDDEEVDDIKIPSNNQNAETTLLGKTNPNCSTPVGKENIKTVNFDENLNTNGVRRRSVSSLPLNSTPTRNATYGIDRNRHHSNTDEVPRRFVLHPSSKVSLEVRRNHSGSCHKLKKNFSFLSFYTISNFMEYHLTAQSNYIKKLLVYL